MKHGNNRYLLGLGITVLLLGMMALSGCDLFTSLFGGTPTTTPTVTPVNPTASELASFQQIFMSSYYAEKGGIPAGSRALTPFLKISDSSVRATVNVGFLTNTSFGSLAPTSFTDYPEPGQTTTFVATLSDSANKVYTIKATTTYPTGDARSKYVEEYYVRDGGIDPVTSLFTFPAFDGKWTVDDPIVKSNGAGGWDQDQKSRIQQVLTFADGTTRTETIVAQSDDPVNPPRFASFDVDGSLDFGQIFYPAADANAVFSSVVIYKVTPSTSPGFWFWTGSDSQTILGVRYYTEFKDTTAAKYYGYSISFEKTLSTLITTGGTFSTTLASVFVGSQFDTLAESVLRQKTVYGLNAGTGLPVLSTGTRTTKMQTRVVNIAGLKDFYLQQLNTDYVTLSSWDTTTLYSPTGNAAEILAATPAAFLNNRTEIVQTGGATIPIVKTSGTGDLATLYASLVDGAATPVTSTATPADSIQAASTAWSFDGAQKGTIQDLNTAYDLSTTGTVETWIYINQHVDTAGIVHKGILPDFSDECFSLQFWGNTGTLAFILNGTSTSGYDLLTSTIKLNTKKWYHLVATWDVTTTPKTIKLYINGSLNKTVTPNYAAAGCRVVTGANLVIGSQLPAQYNALYGYFAFNGKIIGTRLSAIPMSGADVLASYNAYKDLTTGW